MLRHEESAPVSTNEFFSRCITLWIRRWIGEECSAPLKQPLKCRCTNLEIRAGATWPHMTRCQVEVPWCNRWRCLCQTRPFQLYQRTTWARYLHAAKIWASEAHQKATSSLIPRYLTAWMYLTGFIQPEHHSSESKTSSNRNEPFWIMYADALFGIISTYAPVVGTTQARLDSSTIENSLRSVVLLLFCPLCSLKYVCRPHYDLDICYVSAILSSSITCAAWFPFIFTSWSQLIFQPKCRLGTPKIMLFLIVIKNLLWIKASQK